MTSKQSVKVAELRKKGYTNFESWLKKKENIYVGRNGRIWIYNQQGKKQFCYSGSKWANPFKVNKDCSLEQSLKKYTDYIVESGLIFDIHELEGKTLGCWCTTTDCHANILREIADKEFLSQFIEQFVDSRTRRLAYA